MHSILVVDDESDILEVTQFAFEARGYKVTTAPSGEEALEQVEQALPEFLLVDYKLKKMNGLDFLKAVRLNHPDVPAIVITGLTHGTENVESACQALGDCHFLNKPLQMDDVIQAVEERLNG